MKVIGIDLSGPSNHRDTFLAVFEKKENELSFVKCDGNLSDEDILNEIAALVQDDEVVIGIDAPLSYQDGGGDRKSDRELRKFIVKLGMKSGSIMPPTLTKMVYLTLRGIRLSREISGIVPAHPISIVEVHPGAVMGSRVHPKELSFVLTYKQEIESRDFLLKWLTHQGLKGIPSLVAEETHSLDACAAALGAWHWKDSAYSPKWLFPADPPLHPFVYCC